MSIIDYARYRSTRGVWPASRRSQCAPEQKDDKRWSKDVASFKGSAYRAADHAFRDARYAASVEHHGHHIPRLHSVAGVIVAIVVGVLLAVALVHWILEAI